MGNRWLKHDFYAASTPKISKLTIKYGAQGYGIYWITREWMAQNDGFLDLADVCSIADKAKCSEEATLEVIRHLIDARIIEPLDQKNLTRLAKNKAINTPSTPVDIYFSEDIIDEITKMAHLSRVRKVAAQQRGKTKDLTNAEQLLSISLTNAEQLPLILSSSLDLDLKDLTSSILDPSEQREEGSLRGDSLVPAIVPPKTPGKPKREKAPVWNGCEWFRMTEAQLTLAQDHYRLKGWSLDLIPKVIAQVDLWLKTDTPKAIQARSQQSHALRLYATWAVEAALRSDQTDKVAQRASQGPRIGDEMRDQIGFLPSAKERERIKQEIDRQEFLKETTLNLEVIGDAKRRNH